MKIVLIGFACCYKTSAGELLAKKLNYAHIDVDRMIEAGAGKSVAEIFATDGEGEFRKLERQALLSLIACDDIVVSCGGGSVLADGFKVFAEGATVVWLTASADTVVSRLGGVARPLFDGKSVGDIAKLMDGRAQYYAEYADLTVATDNLTSAQVSDILYSKLVK